MRGKLIVDVPHEDTDGITPAHAGKTFIQAFDDADS